MIEIFILSLVQGITEFLPISSSSHLILVSKYINFENQGLSFDISLHIGSFLAVITYFRKDIINFIKNKNLFYKIFISSIPVMLVGFFLVKYNLIDRLRNIQVIGWATIIFGILLFVSDKMSLNKKLEKNFSYSSAIVIGILQIASLIPGVSRSGIGITAARFLQFDRYDSAKISFLLSIPILAALSLFGISNLINSNNLSFSILNLTAIFLSFIFSYVTIKFFLQYIKKFSLNIFVIYRLVIGIILLAIYYL
jgi:undecaprenyl-diphosphatase